MIIWCVDVVLQLVLRIVHYLLLLVHHAHYYCPYLNITTPKTTNCLKVPVFMFVLSLFVSKLFPANQKKTFLA